MGSERTSRPWRTGLPADDRGIVTVELAVSILTTLAVLAALCWGIFLVVTQLRLIDTAAELARQAARGDRTGVARAENDAPAGTRFSVRVGRQLTRVEVRVRSRPFGTGLPAVPLSASAEVATEPRVPR